MNLSEIAALAHVRSGSPPLDGGREGQLYALIISALKKLYLKAKLKDQNIFVEANNSWTPSSNDVELPEQGITPTCVSLIYDTANDLRYPVRIVDSEEIDRYRQQNELCVGFYGTPLRARFTWNPADDGDVLCLRFERVQADPTATTSTPRLDADHHDLIALEAAAAFREEVLGLGLTESLRDDIRERRQLFDKAFGGSKQQGPVQRAPYRVGGYC